MTTTIISKILYADDDCDDRYLLNESMRSNGLMADLVHVTDGVEVVTYMEHATGSLPALVILDLNMPKMDGRQTLSYLKNHPVFAAIPVIILSTSENKREKEFCTARGALSYFVKPRNMSGYDSIVKACMPYVTSL